MKVTSLELENVNPSLDEVTKFGGGSLGDVVANNPTIIKIEDFRVGEYVEVIQGETRDLRGRVMSIASGIVTVMPDQVEGFELKPMQYQATELRKVFSNGDNVVISNGKNKGEKGMVIKVEANIVTLFVGNKEVSILSSLFSSFRDYEFVSYLCLILAMRKRWRLTIPHLLFKIFCGYVVASIFKGSSIC